MKIIMQWAFAALLLACGSTGLAQTNTFYKFAPATGVLKGSSATYVTSAATAADIKGLWTGTCDATTFMRGDGACAVPPGSLANPSGTIGLTAVNGSATTAMRSDAAPPLSQSIAPIWTGLHTFSLASSTGNPTAAFGTAANQGGVVIGNVAGSNFNARATSGDPPHVFEIVNDNGSYQGVRFVTYCGTCTTVFGPNLHFEKARGTLASPSALLANDNGLSIGMRGWDGTGMSQSSIGIEGAASENWDATHHGSWLDFQLVPSGGSITRTSVLQIRANASSTNNVNFLSPATGNTGLIYMPVTDSAGSRFGYFGHANSSDASFDYESDAGLNLIANGGTDRMAFSTSHVLAVTAASGVTIGSATGGAQGAGTINMTGCFVNGVACSTGGASAANPTGTIGLTAVNGVAGTYMRSDSTPPLSQAITPTWSGQHIFSLAGNGSTANAAVFLNSTRPTMVWDATGAAADAKKWYLEATAAGKLVINIINDAESTNKPVFEFDRTGNALTNINFGNATDTGTYSFLGSGAVSFGGGVTIGSPTGGNKGTGTINATGCYVNGSPCLTGSTSATRFAAAVLTVTGSGSCLSQNTSNVSTCTSSGTGLAHVTFSVAFSSATCVASSVDSSPVLVATNPGTSVTSTADFDLRNGSTSALANGSLSITCIGN